MRLSISSVVDHRSTARPVLATPIPSWTKVYPSEGSRKDFDIDYQIRIGCNGVRPRRFETRAKNCCELGEAASEALELSFLNRPIYVALRGWVRSMFFVGLLRRAGAPRQRVLQYGHRRRREFIWNPPLEELEAKQSKTDLRPRDHAARWHVNVVRRFRSPHSAIWRYHSV
jgi:hypothetical protein